MSGIVSFGSQDGAAFRYRLTDSRIWLEHQKSKHQWKDHNGHLGRQTLPIDGAASLTTRRDCVIATVDDYAVDSVKIPAVVVMKCLAVRWRVLCHQTEGGGGD